MTLETHLPAFSDNQLGRCICGNVDPNSNINSNRNKFIVISDCITTFIKRKEMITLDLLEET